MVLFLSTQILIAGLTLGRGSPRLWFKGEGGGKGSSMARKQFTVERGEKGLAILEGIAYSSQ